MADQRADVRMTTDLRLVLAAVEPPLADAWERTCGDLPFVSVHRGSILDVACDAVVSPANSFGFMDGGLDARYMDFFGEHIQCSLPSGHDGDHTFKVPRLDEALKK